MDQWVLKANGNGVPRRSVRPLQTAEIYSDLEKKKRELFDNLIYERYGNSINVVLPNSNKPEMERYEDEDQQQGQSRTLRKQLTQMDVH